jgi:hypothetical protein
VKAREKPDSSVTRQPASTWLVSCSAGSSAADASASLPRILHVSIDHASVLQHRERVKDRPSHRTSDTTKSIMKAFGWSALDAQLAYPSSFSQDMSRDRGRTHAAQLFTTLQTRLLARDPGWPTIRGSPYRPQRALNRERRKPRHQALGLELLICTRSR